MLGIRPENQRAMMDESLGVIMRLMTETDPITYKSDWFELNEAVIQLRPYQHPHVPVAVASVESPAGVTTAGKHGASVLSLSVPRDTIRRTSLMELWDIAEETAAEHGKTMRREDWGIVMGMHLADSKKQAFEDIREGSARVVTEYFGRTLGNPVPDVPRDQIVDYMVEHNQWIVGTPDDAIAGIERLQEISGGFGKFMIRVEDWAPRDKLHRSYELLARYVMPHFQGSLIGIETSNQWAAERIEVLQANRYAGLKAATDTYDASRI
jgi:limonene 1,2-monooxygenase